MTSQYSDKYGDTFTFNIPEKSDFDGTIHGKFGTYDNHANLNSYDPTKIS